MNIDPVSTWSCAGRPRAARATRSVSRKGHRRLGVPPPSRDHRPGVIVEEGNQDRLAAGD